MFTANLAEIKVQQEELHRRASHYRLVKSLEAPKGFNNWLINLVASLIGNFGRQSVMLAKAAR